MLKIQLENIQNQLKISNFNLRRLLVVNVAVNTLMHALLWAALTGACSQVRCYDKTIIIIIIISPLGRSHRSLLSGQML